MTEPTISPVSDSDKARRAAENMIVMNSLREINLDKIFDRPPNPNEQLPRGQRPALNFAHDSATRYRMLSSLQCPETLPVPALAPVGAHPGFPATTYTLSSREVNLWHEQVNLARVSCGYAA